MKKGTDHSIDTAIAIAIEPVQHFLLIGLPAAKQLTYRRIIIACAIAHLFKLAVYIQRCTLGNPSFHIAVVLAGGKPQTVAEIKAAETLPGAVTNDNYCVLPPTPKTSVALFSAYLPQHFLYFLPLPQGQGSLRPTRGSLRRKGLATESYSARRASQ